ncbi:MAG: hypothetical protein KC419_14425 [Anaerolineales bacterium]|nr:hypothetical protein [Anaerolineales bacterium]
MSALTVQNAALPEKVEKRDAFKMLQANYSNKINITPDRWRLLAMAFRNVDDMALNQAVILHMQDKPGIFPEVGDIYRYLKQIRPLTPFQAHLDSMRRLGYELISDDAGVMTFRHTTDGTTVRQYH